MDLLQYLTQIIILIILPWSIWVTKMIFSLQKDIAISEKIYENLKEDLNELKEKLDKLIEIQTLAHLRAIQHNKE